MPDAWMHTWMDVCGDIPDSMAHLREDVQEGEEKEAWSPLVDDAHFEAAVAQLISTMEAVRMQM